MSDEDEQLVDRIEPTYQNQTCSTSQIQKMDTFFNPMNYNIPTSKRILLVDDEPYNILGM